MLDRAKYVNNYGETIEFGTDGIIADIKKVMDYEWNYDVIYKKLTNFNKSTKSSDIKVVVYGTDAAEKANRMYYIFEKDIDLQNAGKLYVGDYYISGYIYASQKAMYSSDKTAIKCTLKFVPTSRWIKETLRHFNVQVSSSTGQHDLDYPHDAPFDYTSPLDVLLKNNGYSASEFRLIVYGPATHPIVTIEGHEYDVDVDVARGEFLTIDSIEKTVFITNTKGETINCFSDRNRDSYIFEKIPTGNNSVAWNSDFQFDVLLLEARSEPKW